MLLEPEISWEFFEIQAKIEGRCTLKKQQKKPPLPRKLSIPPK